LSKSVHPPGTALRVGRADDGSGYGVPAAYRANLADLERIAHRSLIDGIDSPACAGIPDGYPVSDSHNMN